jgi:TATA-box binding protein (TBP) (component of TFIID and TFIIIB)
MTDNLEKDLAAVMDESFKPDSFKPEQRPRLVKPGELTGVVGEATNADIHRATRSMAEQMEKIVANLEKDIGQTNEVRNVVTQRILDLQKALNAAQDALSILKLKG